MTAALVGFSKSQTFTRRSFSVAGSTVWNDLPSALRNANTVAAFKSLLKTHRLRAAFGALLL